jgi:MFS transporter, DHA1 family, multidrug resistance protein
LISAVSLVISFLITLLFVREDFQPPLRPAASAPLRLSAARAAILPLLPVVGLIALTGFARYLAVPLYPLLVQEIALPYLGLATQTGMVNAAAGVAVVLAGIVFGRLADRGTFTRLGAACALAAGTFTAGLAAARSIAALVPLRMAADFSYGGLDPLLSMLLARRAEPGRRGLAFGLAGSVRSAAWAFGAMAGGLLSAAAGFWAVFLLGAALFLAGAWFIARLPAGSAAAPRP